MPLPRSLYTVTTEKSSQTYTAVQFFRGHGVYDDILPFVGL